MALLDGDLRLEIGTDPDLVAIMLPGTLTTYAQALVAGRMVRTPTETAVRGFMDTRRVAPFMGGQAMERVAVILGIGTNGSPIPTPKDGDKLALQGETMTVKTSEPDPAGATFTLTLREVGT